ncbi:MAG TPA: SRPBCC family protein [Kineosporiaceae bacterium]
MTRAEAPARLLVVLCEPVVLSTRASPAAVGSIATVNAATGESRHLSTHIDRSAQKVYDYASNGLNLPEWAPGLACSAEEVDGRWIVDSPMGRAAVSFAPRNQFGVLDHHVTLVSGQSFYNPMRVIADGTGCEVVFTVRRQPGMSAEDFERDARAVLRDLSRLKRLMERADP